jgi:arylsulfatase A-like enzyme
MKRWVTLLFLIFLYSGVFLFFTACRQELHNQNVLLITIDTLRADHLGCYGYSRKITPVLDRLSQNGILFENAFCTMPTTVPSHGSIFFGTWPRIHGSLSNSYFYTNRKLAFLPDLLQKAGYTTMAIISSGHLATAIKRVPGFNLLIYRGTDQNASTTLNLALKWFQKNGPKHYFVWIHLWDPHWPYVLHSEIMPGINRNFRDDIPHYHGFLLKQAYSPEGFQKMIDLYDNEIAYVDYQLGLFLDQLKRTTSLQNTMILVTSDHGESMDELAGTHNYAFDHGEFLFDSQLHVPLIVVLPKKRYSGLRIRQTVTLLDVMPTVLEFTKLPIPKSVDGKSFFPLFQQKNSGDRPVFVERRLYENRFKTPAEADQQFGIRGKEYKVIYNLPSGSYDLYKNSSEWKPFQTEEAAKRQMLLQLQDWIKRTSNRAPENLERVSAEELEQLNALGYVQ